MSDVRLRRNIESTRPYSNPGELRSKISQRSDENRQQSEKRTTHNRKMEFACAIKYPPSADTKTTEHETGAWIRCVLDVCYRRIALLKWRRLTTSTQRGTAKDLVGKVMTAHQS